MKRYAIWNKQDNIITPIGEVLTPEQWMGKHPAAGVPSLTVVCAAGAVNGGVFGILEQMKHDFEGRGCDFTGCITNEEILQAIEDFEDFLNTPSNEPTAEERIAAAMEYQNLLSM